jgi:predicted RNA-binding protein with PUA-like domain
MAYWLMKSEPSVYSIADLQRDQRSVWDGVRNYQARNFLKSMQVGDLAFFYHSNAKPPGIAGLMRIVETDVVDPSQFDPESDYYDPKSVLDHPRWHTVTCEHVETLPQFVSLEQLRQQFQPEELLLLRPGNRLSVMPVSDEVAHRLRILCPPKSAIV